MNVNERIEDISKKVPAFVALYNARVRHYIIKQHIINVYNQFEKYFSKSFDKNEIEWFRVFLLLHDIGKSIAYKKGNINNQIVETIILLEQYSTELDLSEENLDIFNALLRASSLGKYMETKISLNDTYNNIIEQSKAVAMPIDKFFYFLSIYYQCDVASYTGDAGGIPYLEHLFEYKNGEKVYCEKTNLLKLSEPYAKKYNALFVEIKKVTEHSNSKELNIETKDYNLKVLGKIDLSKFEKPKKEIKKDKENIYIIDTNVFVDYPDIISKIDKQYQIVLSAKVIDELDYLKISLTEQQKKNVHKAIKQINESFDKRNLKMDKADLSLLPVDFNKKSPDNFILSVALKYNSENPIMLTSDNGLQIKSKGLNITTITLKEFLKQNRH
ncbi:MAG: hypothetical protein JSU07_10000 [Bacteroidetes bacterium]|nr:hypothetical protein [Bacteroidota bacterium]